MFVDNLCLSRLSVALSLSAQIVADVKTVTWACGLNLASNTNSVIHKLYDFDKSFSVAILAHFLFCT